MSKADPKSRKKKAEVQKPPPERTPEEQALVEQYKRRPRIDRPPTFRKRDEESNVLEPDGDFDLVVAKLMRTFGVKDVFLAGTLASQVGFPPAKGSNIAQSSNVSLAAVQEIGPRDGVEAMLAAQMVATHNAAMEHLRRLTIDQDAIQVYDSIANRATKLLRTFTAQVEALNRYRNAGKQVITVNHIGQVNAETAAIAIGCTPGEAGGVLQNGAYPLVKGGKQQLSYEPEADMQSQEQAQRQTVSATSDGERAVLSSRRGDASAKNRN